MTVLLAVADAGSLSAGSRKLGMPLASVSRKVSELEAHLGARLFGRSSRRLHLTEAGLAYASACRRILEEVDEAERTLTGEYLAPRGELVVTAPVVFGRRHVLPVVADFLKTHPEIRLRLALADHLFQLGEDRIDVAIRIGALPPSSLIATRLGATRVVTCGAPRYFADRGVPRRPADLAAHDCVTFEGLTGPGAWELGSGRSAVSLPIRPRLSVTTAEAAVDAAVAGLGITRVLSYQMETHRRAGALAVVLEGFEPKARPVSLLYQPLGLLPQKLRAFIDFAVPRLRAGLAVDAGSATREK